MNIFYLDTCPKKAAVMVCDSHASKMCVEGVQMLVSGLLNNGAPPELMPLTKTSGKPHKGGYRHHPCSRWVSDSIDNWMWLYLHTLELTKQFEIRYGKEHFAYGQLKALMNIPWTYLPENGFTAVARAFNQSKGQNLDLLDDSLTDVEAYRLFYQRDKKDIAKWEKGIPAPDWWANRLQVDSNIGQ